MNKEFSRKSTTRFDTIKIDKEMVKIMSKKFSNLLLLLWQPLCGQERSTKKTDERCSIMLRQHQQWIDDCNIL